MKTNNEIILKLFIRFLKENNIYVANKNFLVLIKTEINTKKQYMLKPFNGIIYGRLEDNMRINWEKLVCKTLLNKTREDVFNDFLIHYNIRKEFIKYSKKFFKNKKTYKEIIEKNMMIKLILFSFDWSNTIEKTDFWSSMHNNLCNYVENLFEYETF